MSTAVRVICFTILLSAFSFRASAEDFTDAIHAYLQQCVETEKINFGVVVGIVDENGSSIVSYGKMDNGTDQEVNGDTLFDIHSITSTFTGLLLQDMIERGEMKLDDPVAKYLSESVKVPTRNGKEITLRHLVDETSGLPNFAEKLNPKRADKLFADYTIEKMYAFLSGYELTRDPGAKYTHGSVDMGLLANVIALKAGMDYESLVLERICQPLKMDSTRVTLTPELKSRFATEHNGFGYAIPSRDWGVLTPLAGLRSTANDMLKYVSALGLTPCSLTPLMEKNVVHFPYASPGWGIIQFFGGGCAYAGFDKTRRRGVVVLSNLKSVIDIGNMGGFLRGSCEWQSDRRPTETKINSQVYDSYVGQYQRSPDFARRMLMMRQFLLNAPKTAIYIPAGFCLAVLVVLLWHAASFRKRLLILGCAVMFSGLLAVILALVSSHLVQSGIGIRLEGDRLFAQATGLKLWPIDALLPPVAGELLPESETRFFERLSGIPMTFSKDARGKVTCLTAHLFGTEFSFAKISDEPPKAPEPPKPRVAIKLDTKLLDACVGHYEFAPDAVWPPTGMKLTIWREGDQLVGQAWGKDVLQGAVDIYPESETNFFLKIVGTQLTFIKNDKGEVTAVIHHYPGFPDCEGKKLKNLSE
jgi:CubicO group peptidase (beta-lactamase class C family)